MEAVRRIDPETNGGDYIAEELEKFNITDVAIENMRKNFMDLKVADINDRLGLKRVHEARLVVKSKRVEVEKTRKMLKEDSLKFGRMVDGEAKRITALLEPIEEHLASEENRIEDEKERKRLAEVEAQRFKINARIESLMAVGCVKIDVMVIKEMDDEQFDAHWKQAQLEQNIEKQRLESIAREQEAARVESERRVELISSYGVGVDVAYVSAMGPQTFEAYHVEIKQRSEETKAIKAAEEEKVAQRARELLAEKARLQAIEDEQKLKALEIKRQEDALAAEKAAIEAKRLEEEREKARLLAEESSEKKAAEEAFALKALEDQKKAEEAAMRERLLPDFKKLENFANQIDACVQPELKNHESKQIFKVALELISEATSLLRGASL